MSLVVTFENIYEFSDVWLVYFWYDLYGLPLILTCFLHNGYFWHAKDLILAIIGDATNIKTLCYERTDSKDRNPILKICIFPCA